MNEPWTISVSAVIGWLGAALAGVTMFILKRSLDRLDKLEAEAVRKRELKELEESLRQDRLQDKQDQQQMHEQNRSTMADIRNDIRELRSRIDGAFRGGGR